MWSDFSTAVLLSRGVTLAPARGVWGWVRAAQPLPSRPAVPRAMLVPLGLRWVLARVT